MTVSFIELTMFSFYVQFSHSDCTCKQRRLLILCTEFLIKIFCLRSTTLDDDLWKRAVPYVQPSFPPFLFILLLYNNRLTAISSENSRKITYRDPSIQFSYEMRDGWVKWINRTDGQKEDSNELYQYIKRLLTLQLQNIL